MQERTSELQQTAAQLRAANQQLRELDRLKTQFVSNVSHELRTPLTNIISSVWLLDHGLEAKREKYMQTIRRESDLLRRLIEDLLDLSRLDTNKVVPALSPVDLNQLVVTLAAGREQLLTERGLTLHVDIEPDLPAAQADSRMLTQVLTNLMTNAMNYTPSGGTITLSTASGEGEVSFAVADTGPGIAPEEQARLFERFFRGEAARASSAPGTGLGLAICQEIIQRHHGRLTVDSQPGAGSKFTVWLPLADNS